MIQNPMDESARGAAHHILNGYPEQSPELQTTQNGWNMLDSQ